MFNFLKRRKREKALEITKDNFEAIINRYEYALVFFEAPWCGACKMLHPIINELADENREKNITIAAVNTDHERELSQKYSIRTLPTLIVFKNGEALHSGPGMISKPRLQEIINNFLEK